MAADAREFRRAKESGCDIFKISSLYNEQEKCLEALFKGKDVYASLPTGYGKSMIFYAAPSSPMNCSRDHVEAAK